MKVIETKRLFLRKWELKDLDDFFEYAKNPNVAYPANLNPLQNKDTALQVLESYIISDEIWAIELKETMKVIGQLKIYPDHNRGKFSERNSAKFINYALAEEYWGHGYMTEAVKAAVEYAFKETDIELITAFHFPDNNKSRRVLEKCGFEYETTLDNGILRYDGTYSTGIYHSVIKSLQGGHTHG